jgi:exonuclease SbcC
LLEKFVDVLELTAAENFYNSAKKSADDLKIARENLKKGETFTKEVIEKVKSARLDTENKTRAAEKLRGIVEEKKSQIPAEILADSKKIDTDLNALQSQQKKLDSAWKSAEETFHICEKQHSESAGKVKAAEKSFNDAAQKVSGKTPPNIAALQSKKNFAQDSHTAAVKEFAALDNNLNRLQDISKKLENLNAEISAATKDFQIWKKLSAVATGEKSKITFQRYYLNAIFKDVIFEANERLERMSGGRYHFRNEKNALSRKKLEGLDLEIFDTYSGSARPVETLSGGESFLASLSLALGLAAVVKNTAGGIKLDTIFIDEGFGSLDGETLDVAMNALTDLQIGGRLVGIISHVDELRRRIPTRLEVFKTKTGSDARFAR